MRIRKASDSLEWLCVLRGGQDRMEEDAAIVKRLDICLNTARYPHARESRVAYKWIDSIDDIQHEMFLSCLHSLPE